MKYLVIVESPSKCNKVKTYLSNSFPNDTFIVLASVGHFMNLSKKNMGIDRKNNYQPNFIIMSDKKKVVNNLIRHKNKVDKIIIATDLDAEGEKIAYDICNLFKMNLNDNNRMIFNEITESALKKSFNNLTKINMNLVHAQFARRILDRLIGFELSKITAKEIQRGASAGRVLSVTTKLIKEKEDEIKNKKEETYFNIYGDFKSTTENYNILETISDKQIKSEKELNNIFNKLNKTIYKIKKVTEVKKKQSPPLPFITSTINQTSPYSLKETTSILQKLYQKGYITYIRTDSTKMSNKAKTMIKNHIIKKYGNNLFQYRVFNKKKVKGAQEAHECIRPTKIDRDINKIKNIKEKKLYKLILKRSIACLMKDSEYLSKSVIIKPSNLSFNFIKTLNKYTFLGWKELYTTLRDINKEIENYSNITNNDILKEIEIKAIQKYTDNTSGRYTESKLVKILEKLGIGRPSTYSSTINNVQNKLYAVKKDIDGKKVKSLILYYKNNNIKKVYNEEIVNSEYNKLLITQLGIKITEYLEDNFDIIMNYKFTSNIEDDLDKIKEGKLLWYNIIDKYYKQFHPQVIKKKELLKKSLKKNNNMELIGKYKNKNFYRFQSPYGLRIMYGEKGHKDTLYLIHNLNQLFSEVSLNDAIKLLPRQVGKYNNKMIELHFSKNLYIKWNKKNIPLHWSVKKKKKEELNLEDCIICIKEYEKSRKGKSKRNKK